MKQEWINALRSGKYKQGRDNLRHGDHFCCLGVLCDLVNKDNWQDNPKDSGRPPSWVDGDLTYDAGGLPIALGERLFTSKSASVGDVFCFLVQKNDDGFSFEQIADYIEAELEDK